GSFHHLARMVKLPRSDLESREIRGIRPTDHRKRQNTEPEERCHRSSRVLKGHWVSRQGTGEPAIERRCTSRRPGSKRQRGPACLSWHQRRGWRCPRSKT